VTLSTPAPSPAIADAPSAPPVSRASAKWLWPLLAIAGLGALLLAIHIAGELLEGEGFRDDAVILLALRQPGHLETPIGPQWMTLSAIDLSALGGPTLMWLLGGAGLLTMFYIGRRAEAAWLGASLVGASVINAILKILLHRPRPEVVPHLTYVSNASFPSGHAMISAAVYLTLGLMLAETQERVAARSFIVAFSALLVLLIGASRIYLGVHWPSDVLAGWCFGAVWSLVVFAANRLWHGASLRAKR
jgi:undecaprenyl-diphosphatase